MLKGECPRCGTAYCGWALNSPRNQMCEKCGLGLEIRDDDGHSFTGYSPFTAQEYKIDLSRHKFSSDRFLPG